MLINKYKKDNIFLPYVNTGTMLDLGTGKFQAGLHGNMVLNGGLSAITAITGRAQTYKSGIAGTLLSRAMSIHPESEGLVFETEGTLQSPERYDDFVPLEAPVSERIAFYDSTHDIGTIHNTLKSICDDRLKARKDYEVESPFLDIRTGKPYRIMIPLFCLTDSFSRAKSDKITKKLDKHDIDSSDLNMVWMSEGNVKSKFLIDMQSRCAKAGVYLIMTAHVGDKQNLDPYSPNPKQLPHMSGNDRIKSVGSQFEFLTTTLIQTLKSEKLINKPKGGELSSMYPTRHGTVSEVNEVTAGIVRGKNNATGYSIPLIVSQYQGILDSVTNHVLLKEHNNYGYDVKGNNEKFLPLILDENKYKHYTRKTIREVTEKDLEMTRALELTAHLCFIQNYWNTRKLPEFILMAPEEFASKLKNSDNSTISRILNSTSSWTTAKKPERELLTIIDVLNILDKVK